MSAPINAEDALTFCRVLFAAEPTEFRLIHPRKSGIRHLWGALENESDLAPLARLNAEGWGVFAVINRCASTVEARCAEGKGARDEDITGVRAVFVDLDEAAPAENRRKLEASPLPPSLVVCSSPGKLHAYWLVADCPVSEFSGVQKALAERFGSDPSICNPSRIMRVPGFWHTKAEPVLSRLLGPL